MAEIASYNEDILNIHDLYLPWGKLSGAKILVTGATGLIGGCLVETLMSNPHCDYEVFALGRNEERFRERFQCFAKSSRLHFIRHDIIEPLSVDIDFDYIVHAASGSYPAEFVKHPVEVIKANIVGTENLLHYGINHGLKRFLFVSSGEVYGEGDGRVFMEEYSGYVNPVSPRSCYPSSKRCAETLCVSYAAEYGTDVVIARPSHVYGPNFTETDNRVYAQFIRNVLNDENIVMKSKGEQYRSWCYVVDCVSALLFILLKGTNSQAYNIADSNSNITIRELAEIIAIIGNKKVIMDVPDTEESRGYNTVSKSVFSTEKIMKLGWTPLTAINEGLRKTIFKSINKE